MKPYFYLQMHEEMYEMYETLDEMYELYFSLI